MSKVQRFHSFDDADQALQALMAQRARQQGPGLDGFESLVRMAQTLKGFDMGWERGVRRFRSFEEADRWFLTETTLTVRRGALQQRMT